MSIFPFRHCYYKDVLNHDLSADNEENRNNNNQKKKSPKFVVEGRFRE